MINTAKIDAQMAKLFALLEPRNIPQNIRLAKEALIMVFHRPSQLYWPCLIGFLVLALWSYFYYRPKGFSLLGYIFPKQDYLHRSAWVDYQMFTLNIILFGIPKFIVISAASVWISVYVGGLVAVAMPESLARSFSFTPLTSFALFFLFREMVEDFVHYWTHRWFHRSYVLWPFHRVHHSAEVLNPITVNRKHPVYDIAAGINTSLVMGVINGVLFAIFVGQPTYFLMFGLSMLRGAFNITGAALRHSSIWIGYGPILSYIFLSPAQHQIHHSANPKHFNKNYGEIFALWDWMFGTLYVPKGREELKFGLGPSYAKLHSNIAKAYAEPVMSFASRGWYVLTKPFKAGTKDWLGSFKSKVNS